MPKASGPAVRVGDVARALDLPVRGDAERMVSRIAPLAEAQAGDITFLAQARLAPQLALTQAGCVIVAEAQAADVPATATALISANPYLSFARLTQWWARQQAGAPAAGVHPSAVVEPGAQIHATALIGPLAHIGAGARVGAHAVIGAQAVVGAEAQVGTGTQLRPRSALLAGCVIGERGLVHSGAVIGSDGFGFAPHEGRWEKIEQLGIVRIGDDVSIGANTCIDRGALGDTVLEEGVKLDNLIQIAHNVHIGRHTAMAGCAGVAGSARIGAFCTVGGAANILGHLQIVDHVHVSAGTWITRSILKPGQYSGIFPFDENAAWEKNAATLRQLYSLRERLRALEKQIK